MSGDLAAAEEAPCAPQIHEYPVAEIGELLQALADPMRLAIVRALAESGTELSCGVFELPVTKPTLTYHFRTLKLAGIIGARMEGTRKFIHLRRAQLDAAYPGLIDTVLQERRPEPVVSR